MAFNLPFHYAKRFQVSSSAEHVSTFLTDFKQSLLPLFPGLADFTEIEPGIFLWTFDPLEYAGKELAIFFYTRFQISENEIKVLPELGKSSENQLKGSWAWIPTGQQMEVRLSFDLSLAVPLPSLTKSLITPVATAELTKLFERYVTNLQSSFE